MDSKLTLKLNADIIEKAKKYAKSNEVSLSKLIENYLSNLTNKTAPQPTITPLVHSLSGVISAADLDKMSADYGDFLTEKYK
jgi:hypothetical protein